MLSQHCVFGPSKVCALQWDVRSTQKVFTTSIYWGHLYEVFPTFTQISYDRDPKLCLRKFEFHVA